MVYFIAMQIIAATYDITEGVFVLRSYTSWSLSSA